MVILRSIVVLVICLGSVVCGMAFDCPWIGAFVGGIMAGEFWTTSG